MIKVFTGFSKKSHFGTFQQPKMQLVQICGPFLVMGDFEHAEHDERKIKLIQQR